MSNPTHTGESRVVRCPSCADEYLWPQDSTISIHNEKTGNYDTHDLTRYSPARQAGLIRQGYRECPNPSGDSPLHYLPATYADYLDPLIVGLVGAPSSGKTHLLAALIRQAYLGALSSYGIQVAALDLLRHTAFRDNVIAPFEKGEALAGTESGVIEAADILLLRGLTGERLVVFFDVAGEDLQSTSALNVATRFLLAANAMIFVHAADDELETQRAVASENRSFHLSIERLRGMSSSMAQLPAALTVTKSDRLRYVPPADRWLRRGDEHDLNAARTLAESRDVYAYLTRSGATASLQPFETFRRCTLHFVSASGGDAVPVPNEAPRKHFPRGVRPTRVLEPLIAILAMTGMIPGHEADKVGTA